MYSLIDNAANGKDYDVLSAASISVVNDLAGDVQKFFAEFRKDTSEMDEEQLQKHHDKLMQRSMTLLEDSYITIEEDENIHYGSSEVYYGHIEFNTCVPDAQWQTLRIESYDCQIIIRDLTPIEDSSTAAEFLQ